MYYVYFYAKLNRDETLVAMRYKHGSKKVDFYSYFNLSRTNFIVIIRKIIAKRTNVITGTLRQKITTLVVNAKLENM